MPFIHVELKLKSFFFFFFLTSTLSHKMGPKYRKQTTERQLLILVYHFAQEKLPHTPILVIASTYCGKYAVPFFLWATMYKAIFAKDGAIW